MNTTYTHYESTISQYVGPITPTGPFVLTSLSFFLLLLFAIYEFLHTRQRTRSSSSSSSLPYNAAISSNNTYTGKQGGTNNNGMMVATPPSPHGYHPYTPPQPLPSQPLQPQPSLPNLSNNGIPQPISLSQQQQQQQQPPPVAVTQRLDHPPSLSTAQPLLHSQSQPLQPQLQTQTQTQLQPSTNTTTTQPSTNLPLTQPLLDLHHHELNPRSATTAAAATTTTTAATTTNTATTTSIHYPILHNSGSYPKLSGGNSRSRETLLLSGVGGGIEEDGGGGGGGGIHPTNRKPSNQRIQGVSPRSMMNVGNGGGMMMGGNGSGNGNGGGNGWSEGDRTRDLFYRWILLAIVLRLVLLPVQAFNYLPSPSPFTTTTPYYYYNTESNEITFTSTIPPQVEEEEINHTNHSSTISSSIGSTTTTTTTTNNGNTNIYPHVNTISGMCRPSSPGCIVSRTLPDYCFASALFVLVSFFAQMLQAATGTTTDSTSSSSGTNTWLGGGILSCCFGCCCCQTGCRRSHAGSVVVRWAHPETTATINRVLYGCYFGLLFFTDIIPILPMGTFLYGAWIMLAVINGVLFGLTITFGPRLATLLGVVMRSSLSSSSPSSGASSPSDHDDGGGSAAAAAAAGGGGGGGGGGSGTVTKTLPDRLKVLYTKIISVCVLCSIVFLSASVVYTYQISEIGRDEADIAGDPKWWWWWWRWPQYLWKGGHWNDWCEGHVEGEGKMVNTWCSHFGKNTVTSLLLQLLPTLMILCTMHSSRKPHGGNNNNGGIVEGGKGIPGVPSISASNDGDHSQEWMYSSNAGGLTTEPSLSSAAVSGLGPRSVSIAVPERRRYGTGGMTRANSASATGHGNTRATETVSLLGKSVGASYGTGLV